MGHGIHECQTQKWTKTHTAILITTTTVRMQADSTIYKEEYGVDAPVLYGELDARAEYISYFTGIMYLTQQCSCSKQQ